MTKHRSPEVEALIASWSRSLRAKNRRPRTLESYTFAVRDLTEWCDATGRPTHPAQQNRAVIEDYVAHLAEDLSPGTAGVRYRSLRQWFRWLSDEDEADAIMVGMSHPKVPEPTVPVITDDQLSALLEVTKGREFIQRRDHAMLRVLIDTGLRRGELVGLGVGDVDLDRGILHVRRSKTGTARFVPIGNKSAEAMDRYERKRRTHRHAARPEWWLGIHGPFTGEGVRQMIDKRCNEAGIPHIHPHQFRHTAAHRWLASGGQEQDLARIAGWAPGSAMLARYGASAAQERAIDAHRRLAPGDSL